MPSQAAILAKETGLNWAQAEGVTAGTSPRVGRAGNEMWVSNPDAALVKHHADERRFEEMRLTDPAIKDALLDRKTGLLSADWAWVPGREEGADAPTAKAQELAAFAQVAWDRIRDNDMALDAAWRCIPDGWAVMEQRWIGRGMKPLTFRGRSDWIGIDSLPERHTWHYAFTAPSGHLAYTGGFGQAAVRVFDKPGEQLLHWTPRAGSTSNPYGKGLLTYVDSLYMVKKLFHETWATGMQRSVGMLKMTKNGTPTGSPEQIKKTMSELRTSANEILALAFENNALIELPGWTIASFTDAAYQDGWQAAMQYLDDWMTRLLARVLSSNLGGQGNASGSRAAWQVLDRQKNKLFALDGKRLFAEVTRLMRQLIRMNYGMTVAESDMPYACSSVAKLNDIESLAMLDKSSAGGGVGVDWPAIYDANGVPMVEREPPPVFQGFPPGSDPPDDGEAEETDDEPEDNDGDASRVANRAADPIGTIQDKDFDDTLDRALEADGPVWEARLSSLVDAWLEVATDPLTQPQPPPA